MKTVLFCLSLAVMATMTSGQTYKLCPKWVRYDVEICNRFTSTNFPSAPFTTTSFSFTPWVLATHRDTWSIPTYAGEGAYLTLGMRDLFRDAHPGTARHVELKGGRERNLVGHMLYPTFGRNGLYPTRLSQIVPSRRQIPIDENAETCRTWPVNLFGGDNTTFVSFVAGLSPAQDIHTGIINQNLCDHTTGEWIESVAVEGPAYDGGLVSSGPFVSPVVYEDPRQPVSVSTASEFTPGNDTIITARFTLREISGSSLADYYTNRNDNGHVVHEMHPTEAATYTAVSVFGLLIILVIVASIVGCCATTMRYDRLQRKIV